MTDTWMCADDESCSCTTPERRASCQQNITPRPTSADGIEAAFDAWFTEPEGFALRAERFDGDVAWLKAAFEAGQGEVTAEPVAELVERLLPSWAQDEEISRAVSKRRDNALREIVNDYIVKANSVRREATSALTASQARVEALTAERDAARELFKQAKDMDEQAMETGLIVSCTDHAIMRDRAEKAEAERDALLAGVNGVVNFQSHLTRAQIREAMSDLLEQVGRKAVATADQSPFVIRAEALSTRLQEAGTALEQRDDLLIKAEKFRFGHDLTVESRGPSKWSVCATGEVLNASGEWEPEPRPSSRTDEFIARTRFTFAEAVTRARSTIKGEQT